jgi:ATP-dependent helicase/nuclease subunit B
MLAVGDDESNIGLKRGTVGTALKETKAENNDEKKSKSFRKWHGVGCWFNALRAFFQDTRCGAAIRLAITATLFHSNFTLRFTANRRTAIMQTILGPFHPHLESAIVEEILAYKKNDAFSPLLILVPSGALRRHLELVLSRERKLSLLNVHLLTFYQLSARLFAEVGGNPPELRDDLFLEEVLRQLVRARRPGAEVFAGIEDRVGGCAALWQTLRDLRDGLVDPQIALEASRGGQLARRASERTTQLLLLLQTLLTFCRDQEIHGQSDLDQSAAQQAPLSPFLKQFTQLFYYGFYDLTQIQVDFFQAVAKHYPTTLFFPLLPTRPAHDAWTFAERFYERHVQGYNTEPTKELIDPNQPSLSSIFKLFDESSQRHYASPPKSWHCTVFNAFGVHDEVAAAAKEILRLVEDERMAFHEIGVVARGLDAYGEAINEIFREHQIPLDARIDSSLVQFPLTKAVILLFNLPAKGFLRPHVIDLLSSPYFRLTSFMEKGTPARPDLWDLASRELAICKGVHEWRRLRNYANRDIVISQLTHDDESRVIKIGAAQIRSLANIVEELAGDLLSLPEQGSWSGYATTWQRLLEKYLGISGNGEAPVADDRESLNDKILALLRQIAALDNVNDQVSLSDFSQTFQHWLERSSLTPSPAAVDGIRVLNATAARGISFRALFILGMNEGVFPRTIREDAFLRDRDREVIERDLGFKINPKLAAFDEEKLVFNLLVEAAREKLYCSFQRSDDGGRVLAPSWYLTELRRALGSDAGEHLTEVTIPRSIKDKSNAPPFNRDDLLLPEELAIRLSLESNDPSALIESFILAPELYRHGRKVVVELDQSGERLRAFDGAVGPLPEYWQHVFQRGLSPTALETYARCPFQFFSRHVLGLERLDRPEEISGPSPANYGELGHAILNGVYRALIEQSYFDGKAAAIDLDLTLATVARQVFAEYENRNPVGYALAWECLKEQLTQLIRQVIARDLQEMAASGFAPVSLETDMKEQLPPDWPEPLKGATIRGRMDRIDSDPESNRLRVIDYKFKFGANPTAQDKNLDRAALRGERLQPPFYALLGRRWASGRIDHQPTGAGVDASFYYIAARWPDGPLVTTTFTGDNLAGKVGAEIKKTIAYLADGVRHGRFFIQRGAHCQHCDVVEICRKNHPPSLWRAENDPITRPHRGLKDKAPKKL